MTDEFLSSAPVGGASSVTRGVTDNSVIWSSEQETEAQKHLEPSSQLARGWQVAKQRDLGTHLLSAPCAAAPPPTPPHHGRSLSQFPAAPAAVVLILREEASSGRVTLSIGFFFRSAFLFR